MRRLAFAITLLTVTSCRDPAPGAPARPVESKPPARAAGVDDLAEELEVARASRELPALGAAVWRDGRLIAAGVVGTRIADTPNSRATPDDLWHLGSNTKAMPATLIARHVDRGALGWDDRLEALFPGLEVDPGYRQVTIDQLLRHVGGAPGQPPGDLWLRLWTDGAAPDAREKFVRDLLRRPPAQAPGTFVYSNAGYMIAGAALERVTGRSWEQLMREDLFAPLAMASCGFGPPGSASERDQPWGHTAPGTPVPPSPSADNPPGLGPAGTVHCSLADYGAFLALHAGVDQELLAPATLRHLQTAPDGGYAGGWRVVASKRGRLLAHDGSNTMWYASALVAPAERLAFAVVTNRMDPSIGELLARLVARYGKPPAAEPPANGLAGQGRGRGPRDRAAKSWP